MTDLDNVDEVKNMEDIEIRRLAKPDLVKALKTAIAQLSEESKFEQILNELKTLREEKNSMLSEIKILKEDNEKCHRILAQHQKILESMDADRRASNLIISGLVEDEPLSYNDSVANNDEEKVELLFTRIGVSNVQVERVDRLGKQSNNMPSRKRLLKVKLRSREERGNILEKAKTLKEAQNPFKKIYIKKDVSPSVRNEFRRLREVVQREKDKPENAGKNVFFNVREKKVYVDDLEVDCYKPNFIF